MKLIVGLGNPGKEYAQTRHNVGFQVIDQLAGRWQIGLGQRRFSGLAEAGRIGNEKVVLLKPTTYMNRSGRSVREAVTFYKIAQELLLVVHDDMSLPLGKLRIRPQGSAGGHNGLTDIIQQLGTDEFARLRLGIGAVEGKRMVGHVLGTFSTEEQPEAEAMIVRATDAVETWIREGIDTAMNRFNRSEETEGGREKPV